MLTKYAIEKLLNEETYNQTLRKEKLDEIIRIVEMYYRYRARLKELKEHYEHRKEYCVTCRIELEKTNQTYHCDECPTGVEYAVCQEVTKAIEGLLDIDEGVNDA